MAKIRTHPAATPADADVDPNAHDPLLFTPVPLKRVYQNSWTADVQIAFIVMLSRYGVVAAAAKSVGRSPRSAYQLRARPDAESFAAAWDWALEIGLSEALFAATRMAQAPLESFTRRNGTHITRTPPATLRLLFAAMTTLRSETAGNRTLPHRRRMDAREATAQAEAQADARWGGPVDWGAVDLPWFDREAARAGPAAVMAACREARRIEAAGGPDYVQDVSPPSSPIYPSSAKPQALGKTLSKRAARRAKGRAGPRVRTL